MEECLNSVYRQCRVADNSIGPLEIRVVENGTFEELMDYAISRGAFISQYKDSMCVNFIPIMKLLSRVIFKMTVFTCLMTISIQIMIKNI